MQFKSVLREISRNKAISIILFLFMALSAMLVSSGAGMIVSLGGALDHFFAVSDPAHFVQMTEGEVDPAVVERLVSQTDLVTATEVIRTIRIDGMNLIWLKTGENEAAGAMDLSLQVQNGDFDFLINQADEVVHPAPGEIAVPVYYQHQRQLALGDVVRLQKGDQKFDLVISSFVRDSQMNPSLVSSKRFLVNVADFEKLEPVFSEIETLVEFKLKDPKRVGEFSAVFLASGIPQKGPSITLDMFRMINLVSDGMMVAVLMLISLLLIAIAMLCLWFSISATVEEDYREIGIMKAIGIAREDIRRFYLRKFTVLLLPAAALGALGSFLLLPALSDQQLLYLGEAKPTLFQWILPFLCSLLIFGLILGFCRLTLRKCFSVSAVQALTEGYRETPVKVGRFSLQKFGFAHTNPFMGIKPVLDQIWLYVRILLIIVLVMFISLIPLNLYQTFESPEFMQYMGVEYCDMRIDVHNNDQIVEQFQKVYQNVLDDPDTAKASAIITCRYQIMLDDGTEEPVLAATGDFSKFPLSYLEGRAPTGPNEIAFSVLVANDYAAVPGDVMNIRVKGVPQQLTVSGIYQDITNGGRTSKSSASCDPETALWFGVNLNFREGVDKKAKALQYEKQFPDTQISLLEERSKLAMSAILTQLRQVAVLALLIGVVLCSLVCAMFLRLMLSKEKKSIAILKSIGFSNRDLRGQYLFRMLLLLLTGSWIGVILANTLGENLVSVVGGMMGASKVSFIVNPLQSFLLIPCLFFVIVGLILTINLRPIEKISINQIVNE